jgi:hypothetical protein
MEKVSFSFVGFCGGTAVPWPVKEADVNLPGLICNGRAKTAWWEQPATARETAAKL